MQITDIYWTWRGSDSQSELQYLPMLRMYDRETKELKELPLRDYKFNFKLSEGRFCPGYTLDGIYHPCPNNTLLVKRSYQNCYVCENTVGFRSAFLFDQAPNENMQKYLSQTHYIYIAWFAPDRIKVGTAAESRMNIRPIEQDALVYAFVAKSDGFNIKKLERTISALEGFTEFVRKKDKVSFVTYHSNDDRPIKMLEGSINKIFDKFFDRIDFKGWFLDKKDVKIVDLRDNPTVYYPETFKILNIDEGNVLSGNFKGLRGKYLIIENNKIDYGFNIDDIIGREIVQYIDIVYEPEAGQQLSLI